jgi:hypothetical protein
LIYFLRSRREGLIKIGRTNYFRSRYGQLCFEHKEPLEILGVVSEDDWEEKGLHRIFHSIRVKGEWFQDDARLRRFISDHATLEFEAIDSPRNDVNVPIDRMIAHQARKVAESRKIRLSYYLAGLLRQAVQDDYEEIGERPCSSDA